MADSDLIRGNVDTVILKILYEGDRYGYDMIKLINARSAGAWEIKQPTLYACLKRLEKKGFITSYWDESSDGGRRKYYSLTETGKEVFVKYKSDWERTRDLFGGLINEDDPILPVDDFSDVEEEGYGVPKRKPRSRAKKKPVHESATEQPPQAHADTESEQEPETEQTPEQESDGKTNIEYNNHSDDFPVYTVDNSAQEVDAPIESTENTEQSQEERIVSEEDKAAMAEYIEDLESHSANEGKNEYGKKSLFDEKTEEPAQTVEPQDPAALLDKLFADNASAGDSYSSARGKFYAEEYPEETPKPQARAFTPPPPPEPVPEPAQKPVPAVRRETQLAEMHSSAVTVSESPASADYKDVLRSMVENSESISRYNAERVAAEAKAQEVAASEQNDLMRFEDVAQAVSELGNEVSVRTHNDSAKVYSHRYYYYSNRLLINHYAIMCAIMFVLGLSLFLIFYVGANMRALKYDFLLYMGAGLLPIAMFIVAVIMFATHPDKKKRINVNFRFSYIIRVVIMIQVFVVIYCMNIIWGMPVSFSADYVPTLVIPAVYALFIPISEVIYMLMLKSNRYAVQ